jgi:hypothetical protein
MRHHTQANEAARRVLAPIEELPDAERRLLADAVESRRPEELHQFRRKFVAREVPEPIRIPNVNVFEREERPQLNSRFGHRVQLTQERLVRLLCGHPVEVIDIDPFN